MNNVFKTKTLDEVNTSFEFDIESLEYFILEQWYQMVLFFTQEEIRIIISSRDYYNILYIECFIIRKMSWFEVMLRFNNLMQHCMKYISSTDRKRIKKEIIENPNDFQIIFKF